MLIYTDSKPSRFSTGLLHLLPQQPRRGGGGRPDGTERRQGSGERPTDCISFFSFPCKCVFRVFICCSRCVMIVIWSQRHVWHRRRRSRACATDGRRRHTATQSMPLAETEEGRVKKKRRPAVAGRGEEDVQQSQQKAREEGFNDAETQRERRHFAAGDFQS